MLLFTFTPYGVIGTKLVKAKTDFPVESSQAQQTQLLLRVMSEKLVINFLCFYPIRKMIFPQAHLEFFGSEGGAGIPFPPSPFPSRAARAAGDSAKRLRRFAQNEFAHFQR